MKHFRWSPAISLPLVAALLAGCAGSGPDLKGPEGPNIMAAYSGDWVLDPAESDDIETKMREAMRISQGGGGSGLMGSGGGGARRGGGMTGGGGGRQGGGGAGGMGGAQMDPEARRAAMEAIREMARVPTEFSLTLQPETVGVTPREGTVMFMTLGAEKEKVILAGAPVLGTAQWTKNGIQIKREIDVGGGVEDEFSLDENGNLVLKREVHLMGGGVKGTLVYRRK